MSPEDEFKSFCSESPENKRKVEDFFKEKAAAWEKLLGKACFLEFRMKCILEKHESSLQGFKNETLRAIAISNINL